MNCELSARPLIIAVLSLVVLISCETGVDKNASDPEPSVGRTFPSESNMNTPADSSAQDNTRTTTTASDTLR